MTYRTALIDITIERFDDDRIVAVIALGVAGERLSASEEFGPFETLADVLTACERLARGYLQGQFAEHLLDEFQRCAGER